MVGSFGKYEVQCELGHGAFGRVYRAYDPATRRTVAIKALITENDPDALARFFLEVQATAKLKHKNIVTIYDFNEKPPYIVMEFLEGETLLQVINRHHELSLLQKVRILLEVAEGLASAHKSGIVHRDIKPANIMVLPNDEVKIMDFGIARVSGETQARCTRQGDLVGTILYMSPERIQGGDADACSDIFSFGVVAYELIAGQHPFDGKDYPTVIFRITSEDPPPLQRLRQGCPALLDIVIQRATAKDREVRYQSMGDILFDLKPVLLDLEQQLAASMMQDLEGLIASEDVERALEKVRAVLEVDPTNRRARQVHDSLLNKRRRQLVQSKVDVLVAEGSATLTQRQFAKAIQCFETALQLDPDTQIRGLLGQARAAMEANRQAGRLLSEARRAMLTGNLDAAYEYVKHAVQTDPQHEDAVEFCDRVSGQIRERDRKHRIASGFRQSEELIDQNKFEEARAVLILLEPEADPAELADLRSRIDAAQAERLRQDREQQVRLGIAEAKRKIAANQLEDAEKALMSLLEEFPEATGAARLLDAVRDRVEADHYAKAIRGLTESVRALQRAENFGEAKCLLQRASQTYPGDAEIRRLVEETLHLQHLYDRAAGLARVRQEIPALQDAGRIEDAIALIDSALSSYGPDDALAEFRQKLALTLEQQFHAARLQEVLNWAEQLIKNEKFAEAVELLEKSVDRYTGEPELDSLLDGARQLQAARAEREYVALTVAQCEDLGNHQQWQTALELVEKALQALPSDKALVEVAARARENWQQQQRQFNLAQRQALIEKELVAGNLSRAAAELQLAREDFPPDSPGFDSLEKRLRQAQVEESLTRLEQDVNASLSRGDFDAAAMRLNEASELCELPRWGALQSSVQQQAEYWRIFNRARHFTDQGEYEAAEGLLRPILDDRNVDVIGHEDELHRRVSEERSRLNRLRELRHAKLEIRAALNDGDFDRALSQIQQLSLEFPDDPDLPNLRSAEDRLRVIAKAIIRLRDLERRKQFEAALDVANEALRLDPENADLLRDSERLGSAALDQLKQKINLLLANRDVQQAQTLLEQARVRWANNPVWEELVWQLAGAQAEATALHESNAVRERIESSIRDKRESISKTGDSGNLLGLLRHLETFSREHPNQAELAQNYRDAARLIEVDFVNTTLSRITALQTEKRWDEAREEGERSLQRYPDNTELKAAVEAEQYRKEMLLCVREIDSHIAFHDWPAAEECLRAAEIRFPGERDFERLRESLKNAYKRHKLSELTLLVRQALREGNLTAAAERVENARDGLGTDRQWTDLNDEVQFHTRYAKALGEVEILRAGGNYQAAEELLKKVLVRAPDTRAATLLRSISAERQRKTREATIERAMQEVSRLANEGQLQEALGLLDRLYGEYPDDVVIAAAHKEIAARAEEQRQKSSREEEERQQAAERARKLMNCRHAVEAAIAAGDWASAQRAIDCAENGLSGDPALLELRQAVERHKQEATLTELIKGVQHCFANWSLEEAARRIAAGKSDFSVDHRWQDLNHELKVRRTYAALLAAAQDSIIEGQQDFAKEKLREAAAIDSFDDGRADLLLKELQKSRNNGLRLRVQLQRYWKRYRSIIVAVTTAVLIVAIIGLVTYFRPKPRPQVPITLRVQPPQLELSYREGQGELPHGTLGFEPQDVGYEAVVNGADWLAVTPAQGNRLERLDLTLTRRLSRGDYPAVLVLRTHGRSVTNDPLLIAVHLTVLAAEPGRPKNLTLTAEPSELPFSYQEGEHEFPSVPVALHIDADHTEADVEFKATTRDNWLSVLPIKGNRLQDLQVKMVRDPGIGVSEGKVTVTAHDRAGRSASASIRVRLTVKAAAAKPLPLKLATHDVYFVYTLNGDLPKKQEVQIAQGDIKDLATEGAWIGAEHKNRAITISMLHPQNLGLHEGRVIAFDASGASEAVNVHLTVILPTHGGGCKSGHSGFPGGTIHWRGALDAGGIAEISGDGAAGKVDQGEIPPTGYTLDIKSIFPSDLTVLPPTLDNGCLPLRIQNNTGRTIDRFNVVWSARQ